MTTFVQLQDYHYRAYTEYVIDMTAKGLTPIRSRDFHSNTTGLTPIDTLYGNPVPEAA
jgi:hypothetical protein